MNVNQANIAAAALSKTGAATLGMGGAVAFSWSGGVFLSTLENYILNSMVKQRLL